MGETREQRNAARRARYAENKKRVDACDKFSGRIMGQAAARVETYLRRCILEDKPAKLEDVLMTEEEASFRC
jgi:hypothetical protein